MKKHNILLAVIPLLVCSCSNSNIKLYDKDEEYFSSLSTYEEYSKAHNDALLFINNKIIADYSSYSLNYNIGNYEDCRLNLDNNEQISNTEISNRIISSELCSKNYIAKMSYTYEEEANSKSYKTYNNSTFSKNELRYMQFNMGGDELLNINVIDKTYTKTNCKEDEKAEYFYNFMNQSIAFFLPTLEFSAYPSLKESEQAKYTFYKDENLITGVFKETKDNKTTKDDVDVTSDHYETYLIQQIKISDTSLTMLSKKIYTCESNAIGTSKYGSYVLHDGDKINTKNTYTHYFEIEIKNDISIQRMALGNYTLED